MLQSLIVSEACLFGVNECQVDATREFSMLIKHPVTVQCTCIQMYKRSNDEEEKGRIAHGLSCGGDLPTLTKY
ncbi:unnamed protein product, partial [Candidula unifasciata]